MLPILTYISPPDRPRAPALRLSSPFRLLAPRLFCLFDEVPLRVSNRYFFPKCSASYARRLKQDLYWAGLVIYVTRFEIKVVPAPLRAIVQ